LSEEANLYPEEGYQYELCQKTYKWLQVFRGDEKNVMFLEIEAFHRRPRLQGQGSVNRSDILEFSSVLEIVPPAGSKNTHIQAGRGEGAIVIGNWKNW
jgi:hypothetical protein